VLGLYKFDGEAGGRVLNIFFNRLFTDFSGKALTDSIAVYGDWTFDLTDRLKLDIGARYTDEEKRGIVLNRVYTDSTFTTAVLTTANFDKKTSFRNVSPKVSLDFQLNDNLLLYGLAARGFKSGGYNIRANSLAVPRSADPFGDETIDSYEFGSKMSLLEERLFLNLAAFHNNYKDIQLSVFTSYDSNGDGTDDAFFGDFTNAGRGTVNGAEVEFQILPSPNWVISGNLAWLDTKYDEYIDRGVDVASQQRFTNAPDFSGAINLEYRTELANGGLLSANVGYSYQSEVWPTTDLSPAIRQDGYGLLNAGVTWAINQRWKLLLQGSNLTDKAYRTTGYNIPAVGSLLGFYGPPRQYGLTVRYSF
jgi:iron complex outermembrane receptor protein